MHFQSSYTQPDLGEEEPILSPPRRKNSRTGAVANNRRTLGRGVLINRYLIVAALGAATAAGWYFQHTMIDLQNSLQSQQTKVQAMEAQMQVQQQVIERFNDSITNTDVMNRLSSLESKVQQTQLSLRTELEATQQSINKQLQQTLQELSTTVDQAEAEISQEVEKVKKDVEQYVVTTQDQFSMENSFMVYQLAGTFTLLSCLISMWHMTAHMRKLNEPDVQRKILAILWMSPVYAVTSWFSLVFHSAEGYLAIVKDGYEAYIIYQFLSFCIAVLGKGDRNKVVDLLANHADHLTPPFRLFGCCEYLCGCCKPEPYENNRALADAILLQCQFFAMQFVLFRPLTTTIIVVLGQLNYYGAGDGPGDYRSPQFYVTIVQNLSIFIAFTGLLKFYHAVDKDLAWCRPFAKFLCIKGVVFMTFWQGLAISILAQTTDVGGQDEVEWAKSAQNFLICLEMLLFSIAHFYCFPTEEWQEGYRVKHEHGQFGDTIALGDFFQDVKLILQSKPSKKKKRRGHGGASPPKSSSSRAITSSHPDALGPDETENLNQNGAPTMTQDVLFLDQEKGMLDRTGSGTTGASESGGETSGSSPADEGGFDEASHSEIADNEEVEHGILSRHLHGLSEEDLRIAQALEKSLGLAADDPDIADAARRLLESKVLTPDFFQGVLSEDNASESYMDVEESSGDDGSVGSVMEHVQEGSNGNAEELSPRVPSPPTSLLPMVAAPVATNFSAVDMVHCEASSLETPTAQSGEHGIIVDAADGGGMEANPYLTAPSNTYTSIDRAGNDSPPDLTHGASNQSDGSFWAFEPNVRTPDNDHQSTPGSSRLPAPPPPPPNEGTPLLEQKVASHPTEACTSSPGHTTRTTPPQSTEMSSSSGANTPTPLRSSIFTTVAALAEETVDQETCVQGPP